MNLTSERVGDSVVMTFTDASAGREATVIISCEQAATFGALLVAQAALPAEASLGIPDDLRPPPPPG